MTSGSRRRSGVTGGFARLTILGTLLASGGCHPSAPATAPGAQGTLRDVPVPTGSLPEVTVALKPSTQAGAEITGHAWYVTTVRDPARGSYTAAVERRSLTRLWFDVADEGEQRASIALPLRDGRPTDLMLSVERGRFVCDGEGGKSVCALRVSIDDAAPQLVRFSVPRHRPATCLHLAGGDDARRLLAAIATGTRLRIQPSFADEGSPEIEFALTGLNPAIAKVMKHSVAAMRKIVKRAITRNAAAVPLAHRPRLV
jgi:hypothetical protein